MGATRIALIVGGALSMGACFFGTDDASTCDAPKTELGSCGAATSIVTKSEFRGLTINPHETGYNVYWLLRPNNTSTYSLQVARFDESGSPLGTVTLLRQESIEFFLRSSLRMGDRTVFSINRRKTPDTPSVPSEIYIIDGDGTSRSIDIESLNLASVAPVPLDETRLALVAIGTDGLNTWGSYRILDIATENIEPEIKLPDLIPAFPAVPEYSLIESISAVPANDGIYVSWVTSQRTAIRMAKLDFTGALIQGPVDISVRTQGGLYVPQLALLEGGQIGLTWTGAEGVEVRFRHVPADLTGVKATGGAIVNNKEGRQEHSRIAAMPGGGAMLVWAFDNDSIHELRSVTLGESLRRCSKTREIEVSCDLAIDEPRASVLGARGGDVLVAWYDWTGENISTRFVRHP